MSTQLNVKTVLFLTIQFSISTQFSPIWPIDRTLSGATTQGQSKPGSDFNEGVHYIPQSSSITGTSPSDYLVSYQDPHWGKVSTHLQRCSRCILQPQPTGQNLKGIVSGQELRQALYVRVFLHFYQCIMIL